MIVDEVTQIAAECVRTAVRQERERIAGWLDDAARDLKSLSPTDRNPADSATRDGIVFTLGAVADCLRDPSLVASFK